MGKITFATPPALDDVIKTGMSIVSWNENPFLIHASNGIALTSQTIYASGPVPYRAGQVVTNIGWVVSQAAGGTAPTGIFCGICNATTVLAVTGNVTADAAWTTTGQRTVALTAAYTIPTTGIYYHLILENGAFGSTVLQMARASNLGVQINAAGALAFATGGTAQSALPAANAAISLTSGSTPLPFATFST